jgi:hypothetical protein
LIGKVLLIRDSGILPFRLNQDEIKIDDDLLSGFCMANYSIAREMSDSIDMLLMKNNNKIIFHEFADSTNHKFIMAAFAHKYHFDQGIIDKMEYIFDEFFFEFPEKNESAVVNDESIKERVKSIINDNALKKIVDKNIDIIKDLIDPLLKDEESGVFAYALTSSTNVILYCHGKSDIFKFKPEGTPLIKIIEDYLTVWNIKLIPQGDLFYGLESATGLDMMDYFNTETKMLGLCINTSINLKKEPKNELLLYIFGKNTLMRQCCLNFEEILREKIIPTIDEPFLSRSL